MIELSRHIEMMLLENDCVVVPDFGGFIAHYQPARYVEEEGIFLPPLRTVGFNPQLTMNDGMLTQSYMQAYHTDFPDAARKISIKVEEIQEKLYNEGKITLQGIGDLYYNIRGEYEFHPQEGGILSPSLYALDSLKMSLLAEMEWAEEAIPAVVVEEKPGYTLPVQPKKEIRLNPRWLSNAVAVAVAAVLFFFLSVPVENTYVEQGNYASLGTDCLFDAIRSQSVATNLMDIPAPVVPQQKTIKPVAVKVEKVLPAKESAPAKPATVAMNEKPEPKVEVQPEAPKANAVKTTASKASAPKAVTPKAESKKEAPKKAVKPASKGKYRIIVSSLPTASDAQQMVRKYHQQGYTDASVVEGNGRFRIALYSYSDKNAAYQKLESLKKEEAFKSAWMLSAK